MSGPEAAPLIVLAEDNDGLRNLLARQLEEAGFGVVACPDGTTALAAIRQHRPPVALLDQAMPGLRGSDVCREVRSDAGLDATRLVMLTSSDDAGWTRHGADDYLMKPVTVEDLVELLGRLIS